MSVSIDDEAFVIMQRERCEMETEIALLREQRKRLLEACKTMQFVVQGECDSASGWSKREWEDVRRAVLSAIAYAEGADNA